jgi:hypothetical protein
MGKTRKTHDDIGIIWENYIDAGKPMLNYWCWWEMIRVNQRL